MVRVAKETTQAYVVDRAEFDLALAEQAVAAGADFYVGLRCVRLNTTDAGIEATLRSEGRSESLKAQTAVLAAGCHYRLHAQVGLEPPSDFLDSTQAELEADGFPEVEVYLGQAIAPGSFAWAVPVGPGRVRIGVTSSTASLDAFHRLLRHPWLRGRMKKAHPDVRKRAIPIGIVGKSYTRRVLAVGDAAGQVKPTTGGGIFYSILCADLAANSLLRAFSAGDFSQRSLESYQKAWLKEIGRDLRFGLFIRSLLSRCSDQRLENFIRLCREPHLLNLIHQRADFDWHHGLILELIKLPDFWKTLIGWPNRTGPKENGHVSQTDEWDGPDDREEEYVGEMGRRPVRVEGGEA
jgi:flavin-dependent dehydrogenase